MVKSYYIAGIKLAIIITVGLLLINYFIDQKRISKLNEQFLEYSWSMEDSKLFLLFRDFVGGDPKTSCSLLKERLTQVASDNAKFLENIQFYENVNVFGKEYYSIRKTFALRNLELFFYYADYKKNCDEDAHHILYFYPEATECPDCKVQASILNNIRDNCSNIINFALPSNSDINIVNLIKSKYNISVNPSLVVDGSYVFSGLTSKDKILSKIRCKEIGVFG